MKKTLLRRICAMLAVGAMTVSAFTGCGGEPSSTPGSDTPGSGTPSSAAPEAEKTKVTFWYLWGGDTAERLEKIIDEYNAQSDKYVVEGLSVGDSQKIITAISAGNGPDLTDDFASNLGKYASAGVMEPLDEYVKDPDYAIDDFIPAALDSCRMDGKLYAIPLNVNFKGLYYNKTLLAEAGYTEPPKTMEEMYEMAVKTTKVAADGTLETCGFPDFPTVYYLDAFVPAAGGQWYTEDGMPAPADNEGNRYALELIRKFREQFGVEKVQQFGAGGKYLDPTDPFLLGKQAFRIDGAWLGKDINETFKSDLDYGVTFVPYPEAHPEYAQRAFVSSSIFFISARSKNKEGAWDFLSYLTGKQGMVDFTVASGDFPSRISTLTNEEFLKGYDVEFYSELAKSKNLVFTPAGPKNGEYNTLWEEQTELCMNLNQDVDTTLNNIYTKGMEIFK